jgi:ectoine hydroxylase-related dioxygenase (phytanoyl-CoA dioxygenase family)
MRSPVPLTIAGLDAHVRELDELGYTLVRSQLEPEALPELRDIAQRASDDYVAAWRGGLDLTTVSIVDTPEKTRRFDRDPNARGAHLWGDAALVLLDHDAIHALAARAMGRYGLHDMVANTLRPEPDRPFMFHRDFAPGFTPERRHAYLWCFFLIDGFTAANGSTWVVPGTHAFGPGEDEPLAAEPRTVADPYPGRKLQIIGAAGDLMVVNPAILHSGGINRTDRPRRTLNVRLTQPEGSIIMDHWSVAGPERRALLSERALELIRPPAGRTDLRQAWPVLPTTQSA